MSFGETRREARELALQVLFQQEFSPSIPREKALSTFKQNFKATEEIWNYTDYLLDGVSTHQTEIDRLIEANAAHWSLDRMALVELNILRVAVFELAFSKGEIPPKTAINEAIEISKKYGSKESGSFVNGLLDQIHKVHS